MDTDDMPRRGICPECGRRLKRTGGRMTDELIALLQRIEAYLEIENISVTYARWRETEDLLESVRTALAEQGELAGNAPQEEMRA